MTRCSRLRIGLPLVVAVASGCGGDSSTAPLPPTIGTLQFNIQTTGTDIDADGFLVDVDRQSRVLPANGTLSVSAAPGTHPINITGLAFNCDLTTAPGSASVTLGKTTQVDVQAACTSYLHNTILYISEELHGALMAMRPDGSRRVQLALDQEGYGGPAVSSDLQSIAVMSGSYDGIYVLDRFGKGRTKLVGRNAFDAEPAWSPDGTKLAFTSKVPGATADVSRIFVVNRDGTGLRQLTPDPVSNNENLNDATPSWSPDGTRILFVRSAQLMFINIDGTGLDSTGVEGESPDWSHDGTHIAFQGLFGTDGIFVMDMTFIPHRLTTPAESDRRPRWSPDGSQLVFNRIEGGVFHIYKMGADGSGLTKLSTSSLSEGWVKWSPN